MSSEKASEAPVMVRFGMSVADWCEKWFPDALVFAILAIFIVFVVGLFHRKQTSRSGNHVWERLLEHHTLHDADGPNHYRWLRSRQFSSDLPRSQVSWLGFPKHPEARLPMWRCFQWQSSMIHWGFLPDFQRISRYGDMFKDERHRLPGHGSGCVPGWRFDLDTGPIVFRCAAYGH